MIRLSKKQVIAISIAFIITLVGVYHWKHRSNEAAELADSLESLSSIQSEDQQPMQPETIRLLATGDMIPHDTINKNAKKADGSYDYTALMAGMKPYFDKGDINFCNQPTLAGGEAFGISGYPIFNSPIAFPRGIEEVGCNLINLGSNHTNDKDQALINATVAAWDNRDIFAVAGANRSKKEQNKQRIFEVKGLKFGFVAYTDYTNIPFRNSYGVNNYSDELAREQIAAIKDSVDFVIVSMRWGTEYSHQITQRQDQVAQKLADYGADIILGHGSHYLQPVKKIKSSDGREVIVWFSLGNFLNAQLGVDSLIGGFASMRINADSKKITEIGFMPVYQHYEWTAQQKATEDLLARHNFIMVPLDKAEALLAASQLETTVEEQMNKITQLLNTYKDVPIIASDNF